MSNFWQNKKIIIFIALLHHTRFILPISRYLKRRGAQIKYMVGQAERSQEITAIECNLDYRHIYDYITTDDYPLIHDNYVRERTTFTRAMTKDPAMASQLTTVMDKTLYCTAMEYVAFKNMLDTESPDLCFALHEVNRWGKMFAFFAKKFNIPFMTLQEGLNYDLNSQYTGQVQYCTLDLVWGGRVKNKLARYEAPAERIIPVGNTHISEELRLQKKNNTRDRLRQKYQCGDHQVFLLFFSGKVPSREHLMPVFKGISTAEKTTLFVKFHPATRRLLLEKWIEQIDPKNKQNIIFIHAQENTYDLISASDVCLLAQPSTTGIESIAFGKPLIQLDIPIMDTVPYSFVEEGVALHLTPEAFADALSKEMNFSRQIPEGNIKQYLKRELHDLDNVTERIVTIFEKAITANRYSHNISLTGSGTSQLNWSVILPVCSDSQLFLAQLESIALHSEEAGGFEVILLEPDTLSTDIQAILESLEGDLQRIAYPSQEGWHKTANLAARNANGDYLAILSEGLIPQADWLTHMTDTMKAFPSGTIFGGKIFNPFDNIVHAGMVIDTNNQPVSAYLHLDKKFPPANTERAFQMVDHFIVLKADRFLKMGGFCAKAGPYAFMDICLRAGQQASDDKNTVIYSPKTSIIRIENEPASYDKEAAIFFYCKWHGELWSSEQALYEKDGVSQLQLEAARVTRAMEIAPR